MRSYRLSIRADGDITGNADETNKTLGDEQTQRYRDRLENSFQLLAENSTRGLDSEVRDGSQDEKFVEIFEGIYAKA